MLWKAVEADGVRAWKSGFAVLDAWSAKRGAGEEYGGSHAPNFKGVLVLLGPPRGQKSALTRPWRGGMLTCVMAWPRILEVNDLRTGRQALPCAITHGPLSLNPAFVPGRCRSRPASACDAATPLQRTNFSRPRIRCPPAVLPSALPLDLTLTPSALLAPSDRGSAPSPHAAGHRFTPERAAPRRDAQGSRVAVEPRTDTPALAARAARLGRPPWTQTPGGHMIAPRPTATASRDRPALSTGAEQQCGELLWLVPPPSRARRHTCALQPATVLVRAVRRAPSLMLADSGLSISLTCTRLWAARRASVTGLTGTQDPQSSAEVRLSMAAY